MVTEMAVHLVSVIAIQMETRGSKRVPVPAAAGGPNPPDPPDDDDEGDEDDEEEPSDDDDDDRRRDRRSSRRRRSSDPRSQNDDRPRILRKEAEKVNVPPWPKITKLDGWSTHHERHQRFSRS